MLEFFVPIYKNRNKDKSVPTTVQLVDISIIECKKKICTHTVLHR